jgi:hypothetical protein
MKKIILAALLFFAASLLMLSYYFNDVQINKYPDKETVLTDKAIENHYVPALLPDSAYDIEETHEAQGTFGRFYYREPDEAALLDKLQPLQGSKDTYAWQDFLFKIDTQKNVVKYRSKPAQ